VGSSHHLLNAQGRPAAAGRVQLCVQEAAAVRLTLVVGLLLLSLMASVVQAQMLPNVDERVVKLPGAPLQIANVSVGWPAPAWASDAHKTAKPDYERLPVYLQVQNPSDKLAIFSYRVTVVTYDPFGEYLDTSKCVAICNLAPGATDYGRWSLNMRAATLTWTAVIYADGVKFGDGNVWRMDPDYAAALIPGTAPVRFQTWHVVPDPRDWIPDIPKD
jgi:hypothetical protein